MTSETSENTIFVRVLQHPLLSKTNLSFVGVKKKHGRSSCVRNARIEIENFTQKILYFSFSSMTSQIQI